MTQLFPIAAITDEFSQDIEAAVRSMAEIGMGGAELRMVFGKNVIDLTDAELDHAREIVGRHGLEIVSIASPLRSEEHTSELQSLRHLVCRLLPVNKNIKLLSNSSAVSVIQELRGTHLHSYH